MLGQIATHYLWWILALLLIAGEVMMPGYFLLWIGIAAAAMGVLLWLIPGMGLLVQAVLFALLALAACFAYARWLRPRIERRQRQQVGMQLAELRAAERGLELRGRSRRSPQRGGQRGRCKLSVIRRPICSPIGAEAGPRPRLTKLLNHQRNVHDE